MFRDQVGILASWFKGWNECEQTVALLSLLKRVTRTQARFLQLCLEHSLADCNDIHLLESEANSAGECLPLEMGVQWGEQEQVPNAMETNNSGAEKCLFCACLLSWGCVVVGFLQIWNEDSQEGSTNWNCPYRGRVVLGSLYELPKGAGKS